MRLDQVFVVGDLVFLGKRLSATPSFGLHFKKFKIGFVIFMV